MNDTQQLLDEVCAIIELSAPMTWQSIRLQAEATVSSTQFTASATGRDGTRTSFPLADEFYGALSRYRAACYEDGRGAWHTATITLHDGGAPDVELGYAEDPELCELSSVPRVEVVEHNDVLERLTATLVEALPEDWRRLVIEYRMIGRHSHARIGLVRTDGVQEYWDPPLEAWHRFQDLKRAMYVEDEGTWFGVQYKLIRPTRFAVTYNWKREPSFTDPPAPEEFALEQERYPRAVTHMPGWYQVKLGAAQ